MAKGDADKREEVVAVAIDKDKGSQYALKWTVEHLVTKGQALTLVHVNQQSPVPSPTGSNDVNDDAARTYKQQLENQIKQLFLPCRCFCTRKNIKCNEVILEDTDIARALINYISANTIETMVFGASSRSSLVRKFKTIDIPSIVLRGAPDFCTVYAISKGKISSLRSATGPPPAKTSRPTQMQNQDHAGSDFMRRKQFKERRGYPARNLPDDAIKSPFIRNYRASMSKPYDPFTPDTDISFVSDARPSIDRICPSLYEDIDSEWTPRPSTGSESATGSHGTPLPGKKAIQIISSQSDNPSSSHEIETAWGPDEVEAEMRRLRLELKQTMEMYNTACKEALAAKQKAKELHLWKLKEEHRLEEARLAEEAALADAEKEKAKCKAALEVADAAKKIAALEAQKRVDAEMKALQGGENASCGFKHGKIRYRRYTIEEIEAATDCFAESRKIGEGGYGPVYRCELDHTPVAVKVLRPDAAHGRSQFQQEVEVLSCIRHPNMVLLLGACPEFGCLVYEYMANGSLEDRLFRRGSTPVLPWQLRFRIAAEIGTGLLFLHQTKPEPLVHRDLKPANILLDRNYVSKISDVGLARLVPPAVADDVTQYRMTSTVGTFCYIDPEYQQTGMLGMKSDVYSLGVMLLQIITAKPPMGLTHHVDQAIESGTLDKMLDPAVPDWPAEETLKFAKLALKCAEMRRKDRPDLGNVVLPELNRLRTFAEDNIPGVTTCRSEGSSPGQLSPPITQDVISDSQPPESGCDS